MQDSDLVFVDGNGVRQVVSTAQPLPIAGSISASTVTTATAADPSYVEGSATNPLSVDLSGHLRGVDSTGKLAQATAGSDATKAVSVQGITGGKAVPVSAASLPLPSGAATSAKQPALGTAGTASADVLSVQGIASMTALKVDNSAVTQPVDGGTASGSAVANPPVTVGARAATTNPTAVADGQVVNAMVTKHGKLVTVDGAPRELRGTQKATLSNTTAETTIVTAGAAGIFNDIYGLVLANTGVTTTKVDIRDATAGTIIGTFEVPAGETRGFMLPAGSAIPQTTAANNWTAQCASATTAMEITALYIKTT